MPDRLIDAPDGVAARRVTGPPRGTVAGRAFLDLQKGPLRSDDRAPVEGLAQFTLRFR